MADLQELNLSAESTPQVDWDAPEAGSAPPPIAPGTFTMLFHRPTTANERWDVQEVEVNKGQPKVKFAVVNYEVDVVGDKDGNPYSPDETTGEYVRLKKQRASFFKSDKMLISMAAELMRAMGIRLTGALTPQAADEALETVDGRGRFLGTVIWRTFFKDSQTTFSTMPNKKRHEVQWPKEVDGSFSATVVDPSTGQKKYGYAEIRSVRAIAAAK